MSQERSELTPAEAEYQRAAEAVNRERVLGELARRPGLSYARISDDPRGPYLVAYEGRLIGEVRSDTESVLLDWYAHRDEASEPGGPFLTIREAAASLPR